MARENARQIAALLDDDTLFRDVPGGDRQLVVAHKELAARLSEVAGREVTSQAWSQRLATMRREGVVVGSRQREVFRVRAIRARAAGRVLHMAAEAGERSEASAEAITADGLSLDEIREARGWKSRGTAHSYRRRLRAAAEVVDAGGGPGSAQMPSDADAGGQHHRSVEVPEGGSTWAAALADVTCEWIDVAAQARAAGRPDDAWAALRVVQRLSQLAGSAVAGTARDTDSPTARPTPHTSCGPRDRNRNSLAEPSRGSDDLSKPDVDCESFSQSPHPGMGRADSATPTPQPATQPVASTENPPSTSPPSGPESNWPVPMVPASQRSWPAGTAMVGEDWRDRFVRVLGLWKAAGKQPEYLDHTIGTWARKWPVEELDHALDILGQQIRPGTKIRFIGPYLHAMLRDGPVSYFPRVEDRRSRTIEQVRSLRASARHDMDTLAESINDLLADAADDHLLAGLRSIRELLDDGERWTLATHLTSSTLIVGRSLQHAVFEALGDPRTTPAAVAGPADPSEKVLATPAACPPETAADAETARPGPRPPLPAIVRATREQLGRTRPVRSADEQQEIPQARPTAEPTWDGTQPPEHLILARIRGGATMDEVRKQLNDLYAGRALREALAAMPAYFAARRRPAASSEASW
jgi:hypothetical protein